MGKPYLSFDFLLSLHCYFFLSPPLQTKKQQSVLRDLRPQVSLTRDRPCTPGISSPLSRAVPNKAQREEKEKSTKEREFNRRVRSIEALCNMVGPFLRQRQLEMGTDGVLL